MRFRVVNRSGLPHVPQREDKRVLLPGNEPLQHATETNVLLDSQCVRWCVLFAKRGLILRENF